MDFEPKTVEPKTVDLEPETVETVKPRKRKTVKVEAKVVKEVKYNSVYILCFHKNI